MLHEPAAPQGKEYGMEFKSRFGVWMFALYGLIYAGFVCINIISPTTMEMTVLFGLNLAVFYGFFLIVAALVMALIYNHICTAKEVELAGLDTEGKGE